MNIIAKRKRGNTRISKRPQRQQERKPLPWRALVTVAIATVVLAATVAVLGRLLDRPVTIVVDGGGQRVSEMEVLAALAEFDGIGFLAADLSTVRAAAESLPWVDRARVRRAFPAQLRVTITEQVAAARWGDGGLLNTRGELFLSESRHDLPELPRLNGPADSEWRVAQRYLEAHRLITPLGFTVSDLSLGARGAWDLTLNDALSVRLGRTETERRLLRLAKVVVPAIPDLETRAAYVDLRYSNGFAIGWRPGQTAAVEERLEQTRTAITRQRETI